MKNVFITGISRGVGLELVKSYLNNTNYNIYGISRNKSDELQELLKTTPERLKWKSVDLANTDTLEQNIFGSFIETKTTPIHSFISNAAILYKDLVSNIDYGKMENLMLINQLAPMILTKHIIKNFLYHKYPGNIVHLSSICAHKAYNGLSMIGASKAAIETFSRTTAKEYGRKGIRSNCAVVGILDIGMSASVSSQQREEILHSTALKEHTNVASVVNTVQFLASDESKSITGQSIHVNGGVI